MSFRDEAIDGVKALTGYYPVMDGGCHAEDCYCEQGASMESGSWGEYIRRDDVIALLDGLRRGTSVRAEERTP